MSNIFVHSTAIIDDGAQIGLGTKIWHWVHVCSGAQIGRGCSLGQNVFVGDKVCVGNNVTVYDNVTLEDDVFCGPSVVFTNVYNPRSAIVRKNEYRDTFVKKGATLGANCTIVCGVIIGKYSFVGAGAVVTKDIPDYALMVGVPAKQVGWVSEFGDRLELPIFSNDQIIKTRTANGESYQLNGESLEKLT